LAVRVDKPSRSDYTRELTYTKPNLTSVVYFLKVLLDFSVVISANNTFCAEFLVTKKPVNSSHLLSCDVVGYQRFGGPCRLHLHLEDADSLALQNVGVLPHHDPEYWHLEFSSP
jgi:hypothetical protein